MSIITRINHSNILQTRSNISQSNNSSTVNYRTSEVLTLNPNSHITSSITRNNHNNSTITQINNSNIRSNLNLLNSEITSSKVSNVIIVATITYSNSFNTSSQIINFKPSNALINLFIILLTINLNPNFTSSIRRNSHINISNITNMNITYINLNRSNKLRNIHSSIYC